MFAALNAGDWTAIAAVASFLILVGGILSKKLEKWLEKRRHWNTGIRRTIKAVWGSPAEGIAGTPEYDPEQPGALKILADLAEQVKQQGKDFDNRIKVLERVS